MRQQRKNRMRIEVNFAAIEFIYWVSYGTVSGFSTIYLTYRGFSNTVIGFASAIAAIVAVVLQLILSNYCDKHPLLPMRRIISILFLVSMGLLAVCHYIVFAPVLIMAFYASCWAMGQSNNGYLNAQFVQFNNVGIPARYGWPRGMGSLGYALGALVWGILVERYSAGILVPIYLVGIAMTIVVVLCMPNPYKMVPEAMPLTERREEQHHTSYKEMLASNKTLVVLLICVLINYIGNTMGFTFCIRVIEKLGYGTAEYGYCELVRALAEIPTLFLAGYLLHKLKAKRMIVIAFITNGLRYLITAFAPSMAFIYVASALNMFYIGFLLSSSVVLVNRIVRENEIVRGQSLLALCGCIGSVIGYMISGVLIDLAGVEAVLITAAVFCTCAGVGLALFCKVPKDKM